MIDFRNLAAARESLTLAGCVAGYQPWLMADLARAATGRAVFVAADDASARAMLDAVTYFAPELETVYFPAWDCLPYDRASPSMRVSSDRLAALAALAAPTTKAQLLVTTVNAALQRTLKPARIADLTAAIKPGARIDRDRLAAMLTANGYVRTDTVFEAGEYAVRGGLLDLFAAGDSHALRLDFFGDEIETVRRFDPVTQRTVETAKGFTLLPVNEVLLDDATIKAFRAGYLAAFGTVATGDPLYEAISDGRRLAGMEHWLPLFEPGLATLFDYLGDGAVVVREAGADQAAAERLAAIADYYDNRQAALSAKKGSYRPLPADALYLSRDEWNGLLAGARAHLTSPFPVPDGTRRTIDCETTSPRDFTPERTAQSNVYDAVRGHVDDLRTAKRRVILASYSNGSRERLSGLLGDHGVTRVALADSWQEALGTSADGTVALTVVPLDHGFTKHGPGGDVAVLTEQDMLGDRLVRRRRSAKKADAFMAELAMLTPGDLLVHKDHGIGRYEGLFAVDIGGRGTTLAPGAPQAVAPSRAPHDCVMLSYSGGDKLYVPVENIDVLSRYGSESEGVALDKLGGVAWQARKARMKERIREIAGELMATAAARALREADAAIPDPHGMAEFADRFPYTETDDQLRAIDDVLADLASGKPMDRLVCGDVGFGKTEVALRAAYAAALSGQQVAIVCPTTLLARQHFAGFRDRFAGLPVEVRQLSRLVTAKEAASTRDGLADGTIDIVVGTHAILAKAVAFKRLGLVVVDEEQRFGVTAKERLKNLKADVHVLTLTATPIPRTLQMALTGLRELSIIATPPVDRLAVRTYVMPWDEVVLREALLREHYRGGQSFFVTPKIADLPDIEEFLRKYVPEVTFVTAHGQMAPSEVEERMSAFYDRRYDVLLSTTIVESGLDIPSANTMIIHRADRFGLAQLYQLRGRVGRSKTRAYAYMTTPADMPDHRDRREAAPGAVIARQPRRGVPARQPRPRHPRRRQPARRRAVGAYPRGRLRTLPGDARGGDRRRPRRARRPAGARGGVQPDDHHRRRDPHPRGLCPRPQPADGALPPPERADRPRADRRLRRRDDRPLRAAPARGRQPRPGHRDQAVLRRRPHRQARRRRARRARHLPERPVPQRRRPDGLRREARRARQVPPRPETLRRRRLDRDRRPPEGRAGAGQGTGADRGGRERQASGGEAGEAYGEGLAETDAGTAECVSGEGARVGPCKEL